jgi:hypothetical protein
MNGKSNEPNGWNKILNENEWMNGKSIEPNGWKQDFEHEWMNGKSIE